MKRILGVVGSPRKNGNTHLLVSTVLDGARERGATAKLVRLGKRKIDECDGCHDCWKEGRCHKDDDMRKLHKQVAKSDVIVFGTPVYWYGPTVAMKAFLDRFVYFNGPKNRPLLKATSAVLVVPFEEEDPSTADPLVTMFEKSLAYLEMPLVAKLLVPGVTKRGEVREHPERLEEALRIGRELV